jgi:hypothetical protein
MAIDLQSNSACLGTLVIDWANRTCTFAGMDGRGIDELDVAAVQATFAEHADKPDVHVMALIFWLENEQLAVHDAAGFGAETEPDEYDADEAAPADYDDAEERAEGTEEDPCET